jgi:hypothetical protein
MPVPINVQSILFFIVWLFFLGYAVFFAPPGTPDTSELLLKLILAQTAGLNPILVALFNIMGLLPIWYWFLLAPDSRIQKIPVWPFALGMMAAGGFALLPYLALRTSYAQAPPAQKSLSWMQRLFDNRWIALMVVLGVFGLGFYGLQQGDWTNYLTQFHRNQFVHVMSLDFLLLCICLPILIQQDLTHRKLSEKNLLWKLALIPLLGPAIYLVLRPPLSPQQRIAPI